MSYNIAKLGSRTDYTSVDENPISLIPARYNIMTQLGLFTPKFHNTNTVTLTRIEYSDESLEPVRWGTAAKNSNEDVKGYLDLRIPHYAKTDSITPENIDHKFQWEDVIATERKESVTAEFERKMAKMKQSLVNGWNAKFIQLMRDGTATIDELGNLVDYYTEFGITRKVVNVPLSDEGIDPMPYLYQISDHVKDTFRGGYIPNRFIGLAHRDWFDALERHPYTVDSYKYIAQDQSVEILNQILGTQGLPLDTRYRVLEMGGITWVRVDSEEMTANEVRVFPVDVPDLFEVHFAPSKKKFSTIQQTAQEMYYFEKLVDDELITMEVETNFLPVLRWPDAIVRVTKS